MIIIFIILLIFSITLFNCVENFENYKTDCGKIPSLLKQALDYNNIKYNKNDYELYIPCSYNKCEKEILKFENTTGKKLFLIDGCDVVASKVRLWQVLNNTYNEQAQEIMPSTFILHNKSDLEKFSDHFNKNKEKRYNHMYVLKNYAQRQDGIKLTRNLDEILNGKNHGWYLVQDYVYNPYLINNRKINLRYYLLILCHNNKIEGYIYDNGFVYYTPEEYDENDISFKKHITTGYIDRKIYDTNPLTLQDFKKYLNKKEKGLSNLWDNNIQYFMNKVMNALSTNICKNSKLDNNIRFQLFGADIAPDNNLGMKLMEINKGPDLGAKDERDKSVKLELQKDIINLIKNRDTHFIKIY
jgi:hypothetical protein